MTGTLRPDPSQFQPGDVVRLKRGSPDLHVQAVAGAHGERVQVTWPEGYEIEGEPERGMVWIEAMFLELGTRVTGIASEDWVRLRLRTMKPGARASYRAYALAVMDQGEKDAALIEARARELLEREIALFGEF